MNGFWGKVGKFLIDTIHSLDKVNLATADGKALDQFQEMLSGKHMRVKLGLEQRSGMWDTGNNEVHLTIETSGPLSVEERFAVHEMLATINRRYRTNIRVEFASPQKLQAPH